MSIRRAWQKNSNAFVARMHSHTHHGSWHSDVLTWPLLTPPPCDATQETQNTPSNTMQRLEALHPKWKCAVLVRVMKTLWLDLLQLRILDGRWIHKTDVWMSMEAIMMYSTSGMCVLCVVLYVLLVCSQGQMCVCACAGLCGVV
jgi:hypothetical protein